MSTLPLPLEYSSGVVTSQFIMPAVFRQDGTPVVRPAAGSLLFTPLGSVHKTGPSGVYAPRKTRQVALDHLGRMTIELLTGEYRVEYALRGFPVDPVDITVTGSHTPDNPLVLAAVMPVEPGPGTTVTVMELPTGMYDGAMLGVVGGEVAWVDAGSGEVATWDTLAGKPVVVAAGDTAAAARATIGAVADDDSRLSNARQPVDHNHLVEDVIDLGAIGKQIAVADTTDQVRTVLGVVDGQNGASAYELAVAAGFTGTEADWLESLSPELEWSGTSLVIDGVTGPDLRGPEGDPGPEPELTWSGTALVVDGAIGPDLQGPAGDTPELTWSGTSLVVDGVVGPDLKGEPGNTPTLTWDGTALAVDGVTGPDLQGQAGRTPVVEWDQTSLVIDGVTGPDLRGPEGPAGPPGVVVLEPGDPDPEPGTGLPGVLYIRLEPAVDPEPEPVAPAIVTHPQNASVEAGTSVSFTAAATGEGPLTVQWQRNGVDIPGATTVTLTFVAEEVDAGDYVAVFTNAGGSTLTNAATLTVTAVDPGPGPDPEPVWTDTFDRADGPAGNGWIQDGTASGVPTILSGKLYLDGGSGYQRMGNTGHPAFCRFEVDYPAGENQYTGIYIGRSGSAQGLKVFQATTGSAAGLTIGSAEHSGVGTPIPGLREALAAGGRLGLGWDGTTVRVTANGTELFATTDPILLAYLASTGTVTVGMCGTSGTTKMWDNAAVFEL